MPKPVRFSTLPTEQRNPATRGLDRMSLPRLLAAINKEDQSVPRAVARALPQIERAVMIAVAALRAGGSMRFVGAGTSGRLGVLEAAECPPTFGTPPSLIQAVMAGGRMSVFRSKEGAEDSEADGRAAAKGLTPRDVLVGVAASGVTPFVRAALVQAKRTRTRTILVTCHPGVAANAADAVIAVATGPEVIAGSTRLKAGTATKLVLNMITVASMVQIGKVYGNRMVDLQPRSRKLTARAERLVSAIGMVSEREARALLKKAGGRAKVAIVMARWNIPRATAEFLLERADGHLNRVIGHAE